MLVTLGSGCVPARVSWLQGLATLVQRWWAQVGRCGISILEVHFALDLLYRTVRIDCAIYCTFGIVDYVLGVVVARFRAEVASTTAVQIWTIELVSELGCEPWMKWFLEPESGRLVWSILRRRVLCVRSVDRVPQDCYSTLSGFSGFSNRYWLADESAKGSSSLLRYWLEHLYFGLQDLSVVSFKH